MSKVTKNTKSNAQVRAENFLAKVNEGIKPEFEANISGPVIRLKWDSELVGKKLACYVAKSKAHGFELSFSQKNGLYEALGKPEARSTKRHYNVAYKELSEALEALEATL